MQEHAEEAVAFHMPIFKSIVAQSVVRNGSVWKDHENIIEQAMKNSDRWQNLADDG